MVRLNCSSHHALGLALLELARGSSAGAPALGAGRSGTLGWRESQNKGDQDLAFFLDVAACCPVLYRARDGAERWWLAAVARCLWLSLQHGVLGSVKRPAGLDRLLRHEA